MIVAIAVLVAALYAGTLKGLALEWASSPDASYGIALAAVAATVGWQRRRTFLAAVDGSAAATGGLVLFTIGALLYIAAALGADVFLTRISFVAVIAGAIWYLAGPAAARIVAAPIVFLLISIPLPTLLLNTVTLPLQLVASRIAEATLMVAGVPVFRDGNILELPSAALQVAEACSGLRSMVSLAAVAVVLAWGTEPTWPRRAALVALTVPLAIVMNGLRIAATGLACEAWGPRFASGGWHTFTGWITFVGSLLVLWAVQRAIARAVRRPLTFGPQVAHV